MFAHIEACHKSNQVQKIYCEQYGIAHSTFYHWAKKYREYKTGPVYSNTSPGFIPVRIQPDAQSDQAGIPGQLHFLFPNGIRVMCSERVHPEVLKTLLNP